MATLPLSGYLALFALSVVLSLALTPLVRRFARATGRVAVPKDNRWHKKETALLGGVAIFLSMGISWSVGAVLTDWTRFGLPYLPVLLGAAAMFGLGLMDDLVNMDPQHKLAGQVIVASILVFFGYRLSWTQSETINLFLSILWVVGITNAFNLLDNMDGLSAGIAVIAAIFLFLHTGLKGDPGHEGTAAAALLLNAAFLGAAGGFLVYNFNPASIFMGDAGSLVIGFILACLTMNGTAPQISGKGSISVISVVAIPILILFVAILDTGFVSLMRKLFGRRISQGGKDHSSHRLVAIGFSEKKAVMILYAFAAASGLIALGVGHLAVGVTVAVIVFYFLFVLFFWIYLGKVKVYPEDSVLERKDKRGITPILVQVTYKRRMLEVLLDVVLVTVSYYTAYLLRFEGNIEGNLGFFLRSLPIVIACHVLCMYALGIYRGVWESTSLRDLVGYVKAITAATVLAILVLLFAYRFSSFSRAVFVIHWIVLIALVSLSRLSFRLLDEGIRKGNRAGRPTLIYGAGVGGQLALKEIESNRSLGLYPAGFLDDSPRLRGRRIKGYEIFGGQEDLERIIRKYGIKEVLVTFRENGSERKREIASRCTALGAEVNVRQMRLIID